MYFRRLLTLSLLFGFPDKTPSGTRNNIFFRSCLAWQVGASIHSGFLRDQWNMVVKMEQLVLMLSTRIGKFALKFLAFLTLTLTCSFDGCVRAVNITLMKPWPLVFANPFSLCSAYGEISTLLLLFICYFWNR